MKSFRRVVATLSLSSDTEKQEVLQDHLAIFKTRHGSAFTLSLLKLKISIFSKFSHFKFFWKLWTFLFCSYCLILISPQLCGIEELLYVFCLRSTKPIFYDVYLVHNSSALQTHICLPIHHKTYTISAILPSCSISLLHSVKLPCTLLYSSHCFYGTNFFKLSRLGFFWFLFYPSVFIFILSLPSVWLQCLPVAHCKFVDVLSLPACCSLTANL